MYALNVRQVKTYHEMMVHIFEAHYLGAEVGTNVVAGGADSRDDIRDSFLGEGQSPEAALFRGFRKSEKRKQTT